MMNVCKFIYEKIAESPSTRDPFLILHEFCGRRFKIIGFDQNKLYDKSFYEDHIKLKSGYKKIADLTYEWTKPDRVLDIGCGNGYIIYFLKERGVYVWGVDGSDNVLEFNDESIRDSISICDLTQNQDLGLFDLVISTEVAEHIPKKFSNVFVRNIANHAERYIVFSAAKPGQWGDGHINCQPQKFWINLFRGEGFKYDCEASELFNSSIESSSEIIDTLPWIVDNFMLFVRKEF